MFYLALLPTVTLLVSGAGQCVCPFPSLVLIHNVFKSQPLPLLPTSGPISLLHYIVTLLYLTGQESRYTPHHTSHKIHIPRMHRYRIFARISLILSIVNLVLAAPVRIAPEPGASGDPGSSEGPLALAAPQIGPEVPQAEVPEASSDPRPSEAPLAPDAHVIIDVPEAVAPASEANGSPRPSSDKMSLPQFARPSWDEATSGYPTPYLSETSPVSGHSWMLERPPRLSPNGGPMAWSQHSTGSSGSLSSHSPPEGPELPERFLTKERLKNILGLATVGSLAGGIWLLNRLSTRDLQDTDTVVTK
jgi:hypothetical protein